MIQCCRTVWWERYSCTTSHARCCICYTSDEASLSKLRRVAGARAPHAADPPLEAGDAVKGELPLTPLARPIVRGAKGFAEMATGASAVSAAPRMDCCSNRVTCRSSVIPYGNREEQCLIIIKTRLHQCLQWAAWQIITDLPCATNGDAEYTSVCETVIA